MSEAILDTIKKRIILLDGGYSRDDLNVEGNHD